MFNFLINWHWFKKSSKRCINILYIVKIHLLIFTRMITCKTKSFRSLVALNVKVLKYFSVIECPILKQNLHSTISCSDENKMDSNCIVTCVDGYELQGIDTIVCTKNRSWNHPTPICTCKFFKLCYYVFKLIDFIIFIRVFLCLKSLFACLTFYFIYICIQ